MACDLSCGYLVNGGRSICDRVNPRVLGVDAEGRTVMGGSCLEGMTDEERRLWTMKTAKIQANAGIGPPWGGFDFPGDVAITLPRAANTERPDPPPTLQEAIEAEKSPSVVYPSSGNPAVDDPPSLADAIAQQRAIDARMTQN